MAREAKVSYWKSRGGYGAWIRGKQHILAVGPKNQATYALAMKEFAARLEHAQAPVARDDNTMRRILDDHLVYLDNYGAAARTLEVRIKHYRIFCDTLGLGEVKVKDMTPYRLYDACAHLRRKGTQPSRKGWKARPWSDTTINIFLTGLKAACRWAEESGLIATNPLRGLKVPASRSRGRETVLSDEQLGKLWSYLGAQKRRHPLLDVLRVLHGSGARPGEILGATAEAFSASAGALVYHGRGRCKPGEFQHKNARKGKERTIFLTGEALAIVERLVKQYPEGTLFRQANGRPWRVVTLAERVNKLGQRLGIPFLSAYSFRHTFATRWLEAGEPVEALAACLGNSPEVIHRHYAHLIANPLGLRRRVEKVMAAVESGKPRLCVVAS